MFNIFARPSVFIKNAVFAFFSLAALAISAAHSVAATLGGNEVADVPPRSVFEDLGRAPLDSRITIAVTLTYRDRATAERLAEQQATPQSPLFRHFLSNAQFNASFAPTAAAYGRVVATLQRNGFHVTQTYSNNTVVDAEGTIGAADRLFDTDIHIVYQRGYGLGFANVTPAHEPAALRGLILGVSGLQTLNLVSTG